MERQTKFNLWYLLFALLGVLMLRDAWVLSQTVGPIPYSQLVAELKAGNVEESTGAADDLAKVTDIARSMVTRYGMVEKLGHLVYDDDRQSFLGMPQAERKPRPYSEMTAHEIDRAVREIVDKAFDRAVELLTAQRHLLESAARRLMEKETLGEEELANLRRAMLAAA